MIDVKDIDAIIGADVVDSANDRIGRVSQVYIDSEDQHPSWVSVRTGFFGRSETLIPIDDADWDDSLLHVSVDRAKVREAPHVDPDQELSVEEQNALYRYYGKGGDDAGAGESAEDASARHRAEPEAAAGEAPADRASDEPATAAEAPSERASDAPAAAAVDDGLTDTEAEAGAASPADGADAHADQPAETPAAEEPAESPAMTAVAEGPAEAPVQDAAPQPAQDAAEPGRSARRGRRRSNFVAPEDASEDLAQPEPEGIGAAEETGAEAPAAEPDAVMPDAAAPAVEPEAAAPDADRSTPQDAAAEEEQVQSEPDDTAQGRDGAGPRAASDGGLVPPSAGEPDVITRYEERLRVGTERVPSARMRLVKTIVTEHRTVTVPVSHEELRLEREPIGEDEIASWTGPVSELQEEEREIILMAERPVVSTHTAPIERIRLVREVIQENRDVEADLRHEQIDLNHDGIPDDQQ